MTLYTIPLKNDDYAIVRPLMNDDREAIMTMYNQCSLASLQLRYLRPYEPTMKDVDALCSIHRDKGVGLVATTGNDEIAGYAYYIRINDHTAEPAIILADRFHGLGLGKALFGCLARHAQLQGIQQFEGVASAGNQALMSMLRHSSFAFESHYAYGMMELTIELSASPKMARMHSFTFEDILRTVTIPNI